MKISDPKQITFNQDARNKILEGTRKMAEAVGATMGPGGRLVLYRDPGFLYPIATKDGVSVARRVFLPDAEENMASMMVMQAANRQLEESGDGTTLTCVLAHEFIRAAYEVMGSGDDVEEFLYHLESVIKSVINKMSLSSRMCRDVEKLSKVATIATNGDRSLGNLIAEAVYKVGEYGQVLCEKGQTHETIVEYLKGYQLETGIEYVEFITNAVSGSFEARDALVLVTDHDIAWARQLLPLLERIAKSPNWDPGVPLVIFTPTIRDEALQVVVKNFVDRKFLCVPIKPQGIATEKKFCLADIAAITGAKYISSEGGIRLEDVMISMLGKTQKITSRKNKTVILGAKDEKRREFLKATIVNTQDNYEKELAQKSLAKLEGSVAVISVGGHTESEQNEVIDRVDDAIRAARSALEEGVVDGGGVAILSAAYDSFNMIKEANQFPLSWLLPRRLTIEEKAASVMLEVAKSPITRILRNFNKDPHHVVQKVLENDEIGYHISTGEISGRSMSALGIIDPLKVIRTALLNSYSVAKTLIRTAVLISPHIKTNEGEK